MHLLWSKLSVNALNEDYSSHFRALLHAKYFSESLHLHLYAIKFFSLRGLLDGLGDTGWWLTLATKKFLIFDMNPSALGDLEGDYDSVLSLFVSWLGTNRCFACSCSFSMLLPYSSFAALFLSSLSLPTLMLLSYPSSRECFPDEHGPLKGLSSMIWGRCRMVGASRSDWKTRSKDSSIS